MIYDTKSHINFTSKVPLLAAAGCFVSVAVSAIVQILLGVQATEALLVSLGFTGILLAILLTTSSTETIKSSFGVAHVLFLGVIHGGGWLFARIFGEQHYSRYLQFTDLTFAYGLASAGFGLMFFALGYSHYTRAQKNKLPAEKIGDNYGLKSISWNVLMAWVVAIFFFEAVGGLRKYFALAGTMNYVYRSLFAYLAPSIVILFSLKTLKKYPAKNLATFFIGLIISAYFFMLGQRQDFLPIVFTVVILATKWNISNINRRKIAAIVIVVLIGMFMVMYLRERAGRDFAKVPLQEQMQRIFLNEHSVNREDFISTSEYDLGYRLNASNVLLGKIVETREVTLWFGPYTYAISKLVPGIFWPSKQQYFTSGELPRLIANRYNLIRVDYISTEISTFYSTGGYPLLAISMFLFGIMVALLDHYSAWCKSMAGCVLSVGIGSSILQFDHSLDQWFLSIRDSLILIGLLKAIPYIISSRDREENSQ